jgi:hypothetical protein
VYSDNTIKHAANEAAVYTALSSLVNKVDFGSTLFNKPYNPTPYLLYCLLKARSK